MTKDRPCPSGGGGRPSSPKKAAGGPSPAAAAECRCKLQDVLAKLRWETDGEQAARIRHLQAALDVERSLFLKYILENFHWDPTAALPSRAPRPPPGRAQPPAGSAAAAALVAVHLRAAGAGELPGAAVEPQPPRVAEPRAPRAAAAAAVVMELRPPGSPAPAPTGRTPEASAPTASAPAPAPPPGAAPPAGRAPSPFDRPRPVSATSRPRSLDSLCAPRPRPYPLSLVDPAAAAAAGRSSHSLDSSPNRARSPGAGEPEARSPLNRTAPYAVGLASGHLGTGERLPREAPRPFPDDGEDDGEDRREEEEEEEEEEEDEEDDDGGDEDRDRPRLLRAWDSQPRLLSGKVGEAGEPPGAPETGSRAEAVPELDYGDLVKQNSELAEALETLARHCSGLREENSQLRRGFPESHEKVRRLRLKNAELGGIAKRLEERARKLQETNQRAAVGGPSPRNGPAAVELCRQAFARQRARDLTEQTSALLAKDKQIEELRSECRDLQARVAARRGPDAQWLRTDDFDRLLRESQKEVLRLQRQVTLQNLKSPPPPSPGLEEEAEELKRQVRALEQTLSEEQKCCESLRGDAGEARQKLQEAEDELQQVMGEYTWLAQENSRLQEKARWADKVDSENSQMRGQLELVRAERDAAALQMSRLQQQASQSQSSRRQLEQELREARAALATRQAEVQRLQQDREQLQRVHREALQTLDAHLQDMERPCSPGARQPETPGLPQEPWAKRAACRRESPGFLDSGVLAWRAQASGPQGFQLLLASEVDAGSEVEELEAGGSSLVSEPEGPRSHNGHQNHPLEDSRSSHHNHLSLHSRHDHQSLHSHYSDQSCHNHQSLHNHDSDQSLHSQDSDQSLHSHDSDQNSYSHQSHHSQDNHHSHDSDQSLRSHDSDQSLRSHTSDQSRCSQDSHASHASHQSLRSHDSGQSHRSHSHDSDQSHRSHTSRQSCRSHDSDQSCHSQDSHQSCHSHNSHRSRDSHESHESQDNHSSSKVKIFLARYNYDPFAGPNDQPEAELPLTAGEYIYIFGDMDEDGFYAGELMDGQRGLVPSNLVEQISDSETLSSQPPEGSDSCLNSCQEAQSPSPEGDRADSVEETTAQQLEDILEEALDFSGAPCPPKLTLIQQLPRAVVVDWEAPFAPNSYGAPQGYNIYVDNELWQNIQAGSQTRATIDNLELKTRAYRISVQSVMEKGCSNRLQCSFLVGGDFCPRPTQLRLRHLTPTSAEISWLYSNSNYPHMVYLNEQEYSLTKAGVCWFNFHNLQPSTRYWAHVEVRLPGGPSRKLWEETSSCIAFTTPSAGLPDPPLDVLVEHHTSPGTLMVSWIPVTIDSAGSSNGVPVTGYAIYVGGHKVTEVPSPTAGNVLVEFSQLQQQKFSQEVSVRTMSHYGESLDSVPAQIPGESSFYRLPQSLPIIHNCKELAHLQTPSAWRPSVPVSQEKAILASFNIEASIPFPPSCGMVNVVDSQGFPEDNFQRRVLKPSPEDITGPQGSGEAHVLNLLPSNRKEPKTPKDGSCGNASYLTDGQIRVEESTRKAGSRWNQVSVIESVPENGPMKEISRDNNSEGNVPKNRVEVETLKVTSQSAEAPPNHSHLADVANLEEEEHHITLWGTRRPSQKEFMVQNAQTRPAGLKKEAGTLFYQAPPGKMTKILKASPILTAPGAWFRTPGSNALKGKEASDPIRMFVALWDYDPQLMSPNPAAAEEELSFHRGQILKVWGDRDSDGFYHGECSGRIGYIPGDMVSELQMEGSEVFKQLFRQGQIPAEVSLEGLLGLSTQPTGPQKSFSMVRGTTQQAQFWNPQTMVAAFDYHPQKTSNLNMSKELTLSAGDVVTVLGSVDDNGFLYGELNGQRGLVPSNLLKMPALKAE